MYRLLLVFACIALFSCKHESVNCGLDCDTINELIFQTNFNNSYITDISDSWKDIKGIDTSFDTNNDWDELDNNPSIGDFKINMQDGWPSQRGVAIINDPLDSLNKVLQFYIREPHIREGTHKKSRVQADINSNQCIHEYYQTVRLYLHPDMAALTEWDEDFYWLSLFEFWNNANWTKEKFPFRVTVNIVKPEKGKVSALHLNVKGDINKRVGKWVVEWDKTAEDFDLPIGKWMDIELYIKEGNAETGRFYLAITPEGKAKQVVFDITNFTHHPNEKCPDGFTDIHPLKFYTSEELTNYMKDNGKHLEIFWDNWRIYRNKKPE